MAKKAKTKDVVKKTIEQTLWDSANELRGNLDAAEYKSVVLGLVFLKYINDCFKVKHDELVAEGEGFEEDPDEYIGDNIFFVPVDARWEKVVNASLTAEIGAVVDAAMEALEKENKQLKGILPKNYARPELDKRRLGNVIDIFENNLHFTGSEARDVLGRVYEYFLGEFAREEGKKGGEFYTPSCVVRTIVEVIQPYKGKIFDPACGSGGMFVQSSKFIERHQGNINKISVYGQELNSNTWKLAQMNLAICGIEANFGDSFGDSFHDDKHPFLKADFVMANPPFNISNGAVTNYVTTHVGNTAYRRRGTPTLHGCNTCCITWQTMDASAWFLPMARYPLNKVQREIFVKTLSRPIWWKVLSPCHPNYSTMCRFLAVYGS